MRRRPPTDKVRGSRRWDPNPGRDQRLRHRPAARQSPFNGRDVAQDGTISELTADTTPALGCSIVQAESIDQRIALLADCPMDMWVYEAMPM
jgi:hypothetical protein